MHWEMYLRRFHAALEATYPERLTALARSILDATEARRTVYTCGNGGSASTASHLAQDLAKGTLIRGSPHPIRALCLCDSIPNLTAWANDEGYERVFSEPLRLIGQPGDLLIAISGSGNSPNVLQAVEAAHELGMETWGVTGFDGGKLMRLARHVLHVPCMDMGTVEAAHGVIFHWLVGYLHEALALRACGFESV